MVLNFNGKGFLKECFISLETQSRKDFDAYLVDNGSTDGSVGYVSSRFPWVQIVSLEKNHGFSAAYNLAVKKVATEYVVFLNNDTVVDEHWLEYLIAGAEEYRAALAGSKIMSYQERDKVLSAGLMMTPAGVAYEMGLGEKDSSLYNTTKLVGGITGASMLVRTEIFRALGGFDEGYFAFCEDLDLCWRLNLLGHKVLYEPRSVVYHWSGGTAGGIMSRLRVYCMQKNMIRTALKNFGLFWLFRAFVTIFIYTLTRLFLYVLNGRFDLVGVLLAGSAEPLRHLSEIFRQRSVVQKTRVVSDKQFKDCGWIANLGASFREYVRTRRLFHQRYNSDYFV
jgi:hypothetical protein